MTAVSSSRAYYAVQPRKLADRRDFEAPRTPAARIVALFGGVKEAAFAAECSAKTIYRALRAQKSGGTGGRFAHAQQVKLIAAAARRGLVLTHSDFAPKAGEAFV